MSSSYSPQDEYLRSLNLSGGGSPVTSTKPLRFENPFRFFEEIPANASSEVRAYLQIPIEDRPDAVRKIARPFLVDKKDTSDDLNIKRQQQQRDLMFVVCEEARAGGCRDAAAVAFNALFPEKKK